MPTELGGTQLTSLLEALPGIANVLRNPVADALLGTIRAAAGLAEFSPVHMDELLKYALQRRFLAEDEVGKLTAEVAAALGPRGTIPVEAKPEKKAPEPKAPKLVEPVVVTPPVVVVEDDDVEIEVEVPVPVAVPVVVVAKPAAPVVKSAPKKPAAPAAKAPAKAVSKAPAKAIAKAVVKAPAKKAIAPAKKAAPKKK